MSTHLHTVIAPLHHLERDTGDISVTIGFVLRPTSPLDVQAIEAALGRVAEKWRLIAGRLEYDTKVGAFFSLCKRAQSPANRVKPLRLAERCLDHPRPPRTSSRRIDTKPTL
jgi:hypothetical protein